MFRVCKSFVVESGHMLALHPERCRHPHGHTRHIDVVVAGESLDERGMLLDFKALKRAVEPIVERYDHAMAINVADPLLPTLRELHAEAIIPFDGEPTTEAMAKVLFDEISDILRDGWTDGVYAIEAGRVRLERVRVGETPSSWAEYGF